MTSPAEFAALPNITEQKYFNYFLGVVILHVAKLILLKILRTFIWGVIIMTSPAEVE